MPVPGRYRYFIFILSLVGLLQGTAGRPLRAQEAPARYTFRIVDRPLDEALATFMDATHLGVIFASELVAGKRATCAIDNAPAAEGLRCILNGTGLTFERYASGTYTLKPASTESDATGSKTPVRKSTLSGYVRDVASGESLIGAAVFDIDRKVGATSNAYGFYSLTLPAGPARLVVSYLGFDPVAFDLDLAADRELNIELSPSSISLDTLLVEAARSEALETTTQMSVSRVPVEQILSMPALLGEVDVMRAIQMLPGVQSGNEGSTGLYVRGGSPDQNLILIDGAPVYNASHLFGFLSVFNADAIRNVQLTKGGFPARYGGRLSSVLEMSMKEGNERVYSGQFAVGVVSAHALLEGPLVRNRSSFMVAARRSFVDLFTASLLTDQPRYYLYDVNAKVNYTFSRRDRVYGSFYTGNDVFHQTQRSEYSAPNTADGTLTDVTNSGLVWGNTLATFRWNHLFSNRLFSNVLVLHSDYHFRISEEERLALTRAGSTVTDRSLLRYASGVRDVSTRIDFEYQPAPAHYVRFGASGTLHRYLTGALQYREQQVGEVARDTSLIAAPRVAAGEFQVYAEDDWTVGPRASVNAGVHASAFDVQDGGYASVEPRLSFRFSLAERWSVKASFAAMTQYLHLLTNAGLGLPTDLWVPSTTLVRPQRSQQTALGLAHTMRGGYEVSIESYYKRMSHLIEYREGASFLGVGKGWEQNVTSGEGRSYGVEWFLQKKTGRTTGWLGYTLAWSDRAFEALNFGRTFPYKFDRRHDLAITLAHDLTRRWRLSGSWVYGSGNAITLPTARYLADGIRIFELPNSASIDNNTQYDYIERRNGLRMRAYHRLDLGVEYTWQKRRVKQAWSASVFNVYNRQNPFFYYRDDDYVLAAGDGGPGDGLNVITKSQIKQQSLFPIIPSVSYRLSF
ncbi:MAG: TonB-dependent receptor [Rhodothermales bacterium]